MSSIVVQHFDVLHKVAEEYFRRCCSDKKCLLIWLEVKMDISFAIFTLIIILMNQLMFIKNITPLIIF